MKYLNKYILKNGEVFLESGFKKLDIAVDSGIIIEMKENIELKGYEIIDCQNKIISPGFLDVHVHLRDPGQTHKETIKTGTLSAIAGGFTTIFAMPNTIPCMDNKASILNFIEAAKKGYCQIKTYSAISKDLKGENIVDIDEIKNLNIAGFTDDGKGLQDSKKIKKAMEILKNTNKILCVHSEDEKELNPMGCINLGDVSKKYNLIGINNASEYNMLKRDMEIIKEIKCKYHLCHVSTSQSVEIIKLAKLDDIDVSCEVTPHHLILTEDDIKKGDIDLDTNYKMNPPLRTKKDKEALIDGLNSGVIQIIATDHAPHSKEEKNKSIKNAPFGIIGLEQAFSVLNTYLIKPGVVDIKIILNALTYNPLKRFGIKRGIQKHEEINICILDPSKKVFYTKENTYSKSQNTPFLNKELIGSIDFTIIGNKVYDWSKNEKENNITK